VIRVEQLTPAAFRGAVPRLGEVLADAVNAGAGVSFMLPFGRDDGAAYWADQTSAVDGGRKIVFAAYDGANLVGTVTLDKAWPPNQPHRADISKMLVHSSHRRRGVGKLLLAALEDAARRQGMTLLTFDTVEGSAAEAFYRDLGFTCIGYIPGYAYSPTGKLDGTAIFYKKL
jgi:GNAT superfamily N-acetyltransferase